MENINLEECMYDDQFVSLNTKRLNEIIKTNELQNTNEGDFITINGNIFDEIENAILRLIYGIGLDKYLLEKNKFTSKEYFETIVNYNSEYESNNKIKEKYKDLAFQYEYNYLKHSSLLLIVLDEIKLVINDGRNTTLDIFYKMYKDYTGDKSKYEFLNEFVSYIEELMEKDIELKKVM